jgi:hypothetical protein
MLKSDLIDLQDNLSFLAGFMECWLNQLKGQGEEKRSLEILLPKIKKAYEIAKMIEELK